MLLFNWHKIFKLSNGKINTCFDIIWKVFTKEISYNSYDPLKKYENEDFKGDCFILNPQDLMKNYTRYTKEEIVIYVALLARRNLGDYLASSIIHLPISKAPKNNKIHNNRLLTIRNGNIHFLYEEVTQERKQKWL